MLQGYTQHKKFWSLAILTFVVVSFFYFGSVFAQGSPSDALGLAPVEETIALGGGDIRLIIARILRVAIGLLGVIAVGMLVYGGFLWMTAGGNEEQITKAKSVIRNWVIGLIIILSAFAIVQFVITKLYQATRGPGVQDSRRAGTRPPLYTGALGSVIQDHYPGRNAKNVARNTSIIVTFTESMDAETIIIDNNAPGGAPNGVVGDCIEETGADGSKRFVCDRINAENVKISKAEEADGGPFLSDVDATATPDKRTFVFKPREPLGNSVETTRYTVHFTDGILRSEGAKAFAGTTPFYEWTFDVGTVLDLDPPYVANFSPDHLTRVPKNRLMQITFNEAMDPTFLSGDSSSLHFIRIVANNDAYFGLPAGGRGGVFAPGGGAGIAGGGARGGEAAPVVVQGKFEVSNGYKTVTFTPGEECGENACGQTIFCFPSNKFIKPLFYTSLIKTSGSPESVPFSGIMDASGNSLDGRGLAAQTDGESGSGFGKASGPPPGSRRLADQTPDPGDADNGADNFFFEFKAEEDLDLTPPFVEVHEPNVEEQDIHPDVSSTMQFSEEMSYPSIVDNSSITADFGDDSRWGFYHRFSEISGAAGASKTKLKLLSAEPLPKLDGVALGVLFASHAGSSLQDLAQNCFLPAKTEFPREIDPVTGRDSARCGEPVGSSGRIGSAAPSCCNGVPRSAGSCGI